MSAPHPAKKICLRLPRRRWLEREHESVVAAADEPNKAPGGAEASSSRAGEGVRIIILGAGAAGLSAGATLRKTLPSASVRILEARSRIGGRICTGRLPIDPRTHPHPVSTTTPLQAHSDTGADSEPDLDPELPASRSIMHIASGDALVPKASSCSVDLGAAYVHGCNETNCVWRLAACTKSAHGYHPQILDTSSGGYSIGWGENCVWRSADGRKLHKNVVRRAFEVAWRIKREVEYPSRGVNGEGATSSRHRSPVSPSPPSSSSLLGQQQAWQAPPPVLLDTESSGRGSFSTNAAQSAVDTASDTAFSASPILDEDEGGLEEHGAYGGTVTVAQQVCKDADAGSDRPLREVVKAAAEMTIANLKRPLSQDMHDVLRSAEVLIWSYVSTMDMLSTRALRETLEPLPTEQENYYSATGISDVTKGAADIWSQQESDGSSEPNRDEHATTPSVLPAPDESMIPIALGLLDIDESGVHDTGRGHNEDAAFRPDGHQGEGCGSAAAEKRSRSRRLRRDTRFFKSEEPKIRRDGTHDDGVLQSEGEDSSTATPQLTWNDGLVVHGYYDLVPRHLAKGLDIETGRIVRKVQWGYDRDDGGRRICRIFSEDATPSLQHCKGHSTTVDLCGEEINGGAECEGDGGGSSDNGSGGSSDEDLGGTAADSRARVDECDFVVVALPLGVLKERHPSSAVAWQPPLPDRKQRAFQKIGFGAENKVILRFERIFWEIRKPYIQTVDERFRILNGHFFGKFNTLVFHCSPPFGNGYDGLSDEQVVEEAMLTLRGMYGTEVVPAAPLFSHVTRWDSDPFSMGAYSFWKTGMQLDDVLNSACPEPKMAPDADEYSTHDEVGSVDHRTAMRKLHSSDLRAPQLYFCGEHATIRDAQCVHGACNSGERAARQLSLAALGHLSDLDTCIRGGETFWYTEPKVTTRPKEFSPQGVESSLSPLRSHGSGDFDGGGSEGSSIISEAGRSLIFDPCYSPFPSPEDVRWHRERWEFSCVCGISGDGYDDGTSMIQCHRCGVWQHSSCVNMYSSPWVQVHRDDSPARSSRVPDVVHTCHACEPSNFKPCPALGGGGGRVAQGAPVGATPTMSSSANVLPQVSFWNEIDIQDDLDLDTNMDSDSEGVSNAAKVHSGEEETGRDADGMSTETEGVSCGDPVQGETAAIDGGSACGSHEPHVTGLCAGRSTRRWRVQLTDDLVSDYAARCDAEIGVQGGQMGRFNEDDMNLLQVSNCVKWQGLVRALRDTGALLVDTAQAIMVSERERANLPGFSVLQRPKAKCEEDTGVSEVVACSGPNGWSSPGAASSTMPLKRKFSPSY